MASVRPIPTSYYYSGQGRLGIGERDSTTGELKNVVFVGNVTSLTIDIATDKFEHKESMSGNRAVDVTVIKEKNGTFKFTSESLTLDLLSVGLYGTNSAVTGASVTNETHVATKGTAIPLKYPNISAITVTKVAGAVPLVEGTDFAYDAGFGTVYILATSTVITTANEPVEVDYTYGGHTRLDAFMDGTPPERYLRFEGLNTIDGDLRLLEIPRAALDPLTGLEYINEELGSGEFGGNILPDTTILSGSQYFRELRIAA